MMTQPHIKEASAKLIEAFKAMANEERIQILMLLHENGEMFAQDVEKHFYLEQSTTSHHLNTLRRAGLAKTRKEGRKIYYSLEYDHLKHFISDLSACFFKPE